MVIVKTCWVGGSSGRGRGMRSSWLPKYVCVLADCKRCFEKMGWVRFTNEI